MDESGFCAWSEPTYTYYKRGEQKRLEQTHRRGRRLSIVGLFQHEISFVYGLVIGGGERKAYIKMMESYHVRSIDRDTILRNTTPLIQMPRRMTIAPHLSTEELQARFRHAKTPTVAHHYQIMWLRRLWENYRRSNGSDRL